MACVLVEINKKLNKVTGLWTKRTSLKPHNLRHYYTKNSLPELERIKEVCSGSFVFFYISPEFLGESLVRLSELPEDHYD